MAWREALHCSQDSRCLRSIPSCIEADPHEINNLANSPKPEHRQALLQMRIALNTWIVETQDQGEFPEPAGVVAPFDKEMHDWFGTPEWYGKN